MQDRRAQEADLLRRATPGDLSAAEAKKLVEGANVPDLADVAREAEEKRREEEQRQQALRQTVARRWDNKMHRAFKGIFTRKERHKMLFNYQQRAEKEAT